MNEPVAPPSIPAPDPAAPAPTAGQLLKRAREAQGLHIAALAAALKVPQRKLEALERDRHDELPDATFARALALAVCRALKVDAAPVLALLPRQEDSRLDHVASGLNMPFRERSTLIDPDWAAILRRPVLWLVLALLVAAALVWFWPVTPTASLLPAEEAASAVLPGLPDAAAAASAPEEPASAGEAAAAGEAASAGLSQGLTSMGATPAATGAATASAPVTTGPAALRIHARAASWIQVLDADQRNLVSRTVAAGEELTLEGRLPLRVIIGNAAATELRFRGQLLDLLPATRDNIARLELK